MTLGNLHGLLNAGRRVDGHKIANGKVAMKAAAENRPVLRFIVVALILLVAGAEIGIALQLVGLIDLVGVELFLTFFFAGFLWRFRVAVNVIKAALERLDPFFFVPTRSQVISCPTLLVHAVPGLVSICLVGYVATELSAEWMT